MKCHRFIGDFDLRQSTLSLQEAGIVHQMTKVLKLKPKEEIILCDGKGGESHATIERIEKNTVTVALHDQNIINNIDRRQVTLYCAVLKRENFELVAQKCTELGLYRLVPIITRRTVKQKTNLDRIKKIMHEASEQSGRGYLPELSEIMDFDAALEDCRTNEINIIYEVNAQERANNRKPRSIGIFIGPEGGWEPAEIEQAQRCGLKQGSLGELTLRAETAAIIGTFVALNA